MSKQNIYKFSLIFLAGIIFAISSEKVIKKSSTLLRNKMIPTFIEKQVKKNEQDCPKESIVIAYFGQSNSAGYVKPKAKIDYKKNLLQYDWRNNKCYSYSEPLLGSEGRFGNSITYFANSISNKTDKNVIIVSFGKAGSSVISWSYGTLNKLLGFILNQLNNNKITVDIFLWHQGESDVKITSSNINNLKKVPYFKGNFNELIYEGLDKKTYKQALKKIVKDTRKVYPNSKFGIALATICLVENSYIPIFNAQKEITLEISNTFISGNSDILKGKKMRYDGCHLSDNGAKELGKQYLFNTNKFLINKY